MYYSLTRFDLCHFCAPSRMNFFVYLLSDENCIYFINFVSQIINRNSYNSDKRLFGQVSFRLAEIFFRYLAEYGSDGKSLSRIFESGRVIVATISNTKDKGQKQISTVEYG